LKVLHVIPAIASCYGGPSKVVLDSCKALRAEGVAAEIATTNANGVGNHPIPPAEPATVQGVPVYFFERQYPWRYKFSWDLTKWLKANVARYDLLHLHAVFSYSTSAAAFYARKHSVPYIIVPHGMLAPWPVRKNWLLKKVYLKAIEQKNLERAAAVHFTAEEELHMSIRRGRSNFVLPCIVDFDLNVNGIRPRSARPRLRVLFLSRIDPKKGIDLLIEALGRLAREGREFDFILAGSGDPSYEERVRAMISITGLSERTTFAGFVEGAAKAALFETADIFVLPSHHENFGIAVVEAMAFGLPIIISNRVNIHSEIERAEAGLVVSPTAAELAVAITTLADNPTMRIEMGKKGRQFVATEFSGASTARETVRIYRDIIHESRHSNAWKASPDSLAV
jgi:glycosyltransferase involved in cell wall biosynthesis